MHRHSGLLPGEKTDLDGFGVTTLARTLYDLALKLTLANLVCAVDSALRKGWVPGSGPTRGRQLLRQALALADARSESPLETLTRLLLVGAGLAPEVLQLSMRDGAGRVYARWDMAWPSVRVAIEVDGARYHDDPEPLYRDRFKSNTGGTAGWLILRFTWYDVTQRLEWVREALSSR